MHVQNFGLPESHWNCSKRPIDYKHGHLLKDLFKRLQEVETAEKETFSILTDVMEEKDLDGSYSPVLNSEESELDDDQEVCREECRGGCPYKIKRQRILSEIEADARNDNV